ncbi:ribonuclease D [Clostridium butyricum]|uniref:ribonuclease D n=1 Tax=Clostridium butyricum TaxID=1492 RepID=UPI001CA9DDC9|nr:ribonuclease D [Clostridium butyricum]MBZ0312754.1 ribonuclease D [Clostridium butyricum]
MKNEYTYTNNDISNDDYKWIKDECKYMAIDTETTGLDSINDELCLIQIGANGRYFLIKYFKENNYKNIKKLLEDNEIIKVFHNAIFDVRFIMNNFDNIQIRNIVCTKISAKLINGIDKKSSLKDLLLENFNIKIDKKQQLSDWSKSELSLEQLEYATNDVKYLVRLWRKLELQLESKCILEYAMRCFEFIPIQAYLNRQGINNIFDY